MSHFIHAHKDELFCNRCERYFNKWIEGLEIDGELHHEKCLNWVCGIEDAFGDLSDTSPSIQRIKEEGKVLDE